MKIAMCQTNPVLLDVTANVEKTIEKINKCREEGADLIVFPELALTGYFVGLNYHKAALQMDSYEIRRIAAATRGTAAVVGFIEESQSMNFYNSALVAVDGKLLFAYRKLNLPNYGVFEERKFFSSGKHIKVFRLCGLNVAVFICNDMWHPSLPYLGIAQKADIFLTLFNSSEGSMADEFSNIESWEIINRFYSRIFGIYNICVNRVGEEGPEQIRCGVPHNTDTGFPDAFRLPEVAKTYHFWGGSEIINPFGQAIHSAKKFQEDTVLGSISKDMLRRKKIVLPYLKNDDPYFTHRELGRILYASGENLP
ncbi:MAG: nitrilase-related carbon-nitrogen hydrolase [Desulfotignum sp.]|jgi:predicted amidohydrolase|nr:nitrilase-related carbon-nitrogen hydrolase [Desulfotignum sp.]